MVIFHSYVSLPEGILVYRPHQSINASPVVTRCESPPRDLAPGEIHGVNMVDFPHLIPAMTGRPEGKYTFPGGIPLMSKPLIRILKRQWINGLRESQGSHRSVSSDFHVPVD